MTSEKVVPETELRHLGPQTAAGIKAEYAYYFADQLVRDMVDSGHFAMTSDVLNIGSQTSPHDTFKRFLDAKAESTLATDDIVPTITTEEPKGS